MAEGTGGVSFTRTANVEGLMQQVARDFDSFYSLGYSPPHGDDGEIHAIEVRLRDRQKSKDYTVRHLSAPRERDPVEHLADLTLSALHFDMIDNALDVQLEPQSSEPTSGKRHLVRVMVKIPFQNLLLLPDRRATADRSTDPGPELPGFPDCSTGSRLPSPAGDQGRSEESSRRCP